MEELLKSPALAPAIMSLGIGLPILLMFLTGRLPTPTQDKEKSMRIAFLESEVEKLNSRIAELPSRTERDTLETELMNVRTNLRHDLDNKDKRIAELDEYMKQLVRESFRQQETVQQVTSTLASLSQQLPVLVYALTDFLDKERRGPDGPISNSRRGPGPSS